MNGRPLTDERIAAVLRGIAPAGAQTGLAGRISTGVRTTPQQRRLPWFLGVLSGPGPLTGRRTLLVATAFMVALALATTAVVAVLRQRQDDPLPTRRGLLAYVQQGDLYLAGPDGAGEMLAAHVDGTGLSDPHWSPDGRWVAVRTDEPAVLALDTQTLEMRRIGPGVVGDWSPDGKRIVVTSQSYELSIVDLESGVAQVVPPQPGTRGFDSSPSWSWDGRWLAVGTCCGQSQLLRIDAATGDVITLDPIESRWGFDSAWSPDSTRLAFIQKHELRREAPAPLVVVDADGTNRVDAAEAEEAPGEPHWSPDGAWIAYHAASRGSLMIVRPDGTDRRRLASLTGSIIGWSPDGTSIAVTRSSLDSSGVNEVLVADGSTRELLAPGESSGFTWATLPASDPAPVPPTRPVATASPSDEPSATPPARPLDAPGPWGALAFDTRYGLQSGSDVCETLLLRLPDQVTSVQHAPTPGQCLDNRLPDGYALGQILWSPDGTGFARVAPTATGGTLEVFGVDGTARSGTIPIGLGGVAWSPDGTWLAALGCPPTEGCAAGWFLVRPDGSDVRRLPGRPEWSADGKWLSVETDDGHLLVGRPDGADLTDIGAYPQPEAWSPDGRQFAFIRDGNVWIANADGGDARNLSMFGLGGVTRAWWSPDGRWIAVLRGDTLFVLDPVSGDQRRLGSSFGSGSVAWSPDASSLAAVGAEETVILFDASTWRPTILPSIRTVAWSPDSRYIAGVLRTSSPEGVVVMNADGSGRTSLWLGPDGSGAYVNALLWVP